LHAATACITGFYFQTTVGLIIEFKFKLCFADGYHGRINQSINQNL